MKKLILVLSLLAMAILPAFAQIWYIQIPKDQVETYMTKLDVLKGPSPYTLHYTAPIESKMATVTTVILPIDERAQTVLTEEEWNNKLVDMPEEFKNSIHP